jgi:hypothetical protein
MTVRGESKRQERVATAEQQDGEFLEMHCIAEMNAPFPCSAFRVIVIVECS